MPLLDGDDPLDIVRATLRILLAGGTVVALVVWLALGEPRMLELATALWAMYGIMQAVVNGFLSPMTDLPAVISGDVRTGEASRDPELAALTSSPEFRAADAHYRTPAVPSALVADGIRHAVHDGQTSEGAARAVRALETLRTRERLSASDDVQVGLALVRLHEEQLGDAAAALREFRRLIYRHPAPPATDEIRHALADIVPRFLPADMAENQVH
ncbi:MAG: hypothetical protein ACREL4_01530 [Gemmatimonadales bacterium]